MKGQDADRLAGVLAQCPALAHLDVSGNLNFGTSGATRFAGVQGQCRELVHLNLSYNWIEEDREACRSAGAVHSAGAPQWDLNLQSNRIGNTGAESLPGVLGQCTELTHLNLRFQ
jgi:hypothetical protein